MDWDISLLQLAFIYTPGLLWAYIDRTHGYDRDAPLGFFLIKVHLFGTLTYIVSVFLLLIPWAPTYFISQYFEFKILTYLSPLYFWVVIATSIPVSLILARTYLKLNRNQVFTDYLKKFGAHIVKGGDSFWEYAVGEILKEKGQINLIDSEENLRYTGIHISSTRIEGMREILLKDAKVLDLNGNLISEAKFMHIIRPIEKIRLEIFENATNPTVRKLKNDNFT